jgi:hypothetical protein
MMTTVRPVTCWISASMTRRCRLDTDALVPTQAPAFAAPRTIAAARRASASAVCATRRSASFAPAVRSTRRAGSAAAQGRGALVVAAADGAKSNTIVDAAIADPQFSVLVEAVVKVCAPPSAAPGHKAVARAFPRLGFLVSPSGGRTAVAPLKGDTRHLAPRKHALSPEEWRCAAPARRDGRRRRTTALVALRLRLPPASLAGPIPGGMRCSPLIATQLGASTLRE